MSLRSILGDSNRVKKRQSSSSSRSTSDSSPSSWSTNRQRRKPPAVISSEKQSVASKLSHEFEDDDQDILNHPLDHHGLVSALMTDLQLRDVPQVVKHVCENMFAPIPTRGLSSSLRIAIASRREGIPPLVSAAHVQALLTATPTKVERETVELVHAGILRRVDVPSRGAAGEVLVLSAEYEALVGRAQGLDQDTREAYLSLLRENPSAATVLAGPSSELSVAQAERLFRAGFLTSVVQGHAAADGIFSRPEDRTMLLSLATVARAPSGTVGAVGGQGGAREHATGRGGVGSPWPAGSGGATKMRTEYRIAVPGAGAFLKLAIAGLEHFKTLLMRLPHREAPEYLLREKWDGGTAKGCGVQEAARLARGEKVGTLPGRTRRWRDLMGLQFEWVLAEAVGAGIVEVFETGSVGRGVRLLAN